MGTRHIVEVVKGNKLAIRQYGQWDGYAEIAAYHLRKFIKKHGVEKIRELVDLTEIQNTIQCHNVDKPDFLLTTSDFHMSESLVGYHANAIDKYIETIGRTGTFEKYDLKKIVPALMEKFDLEEVMAYYMMTRDTGYRILDVIYAFSRFKEVASGDCKIPVFLEDENIDTCRKIIINLDTETFTCIYFDGEQSWSFDKLPTLAELRKVDKW